MQKISPDFIKFFSKFNVNALVDTCMYDCTSVQYEDMRPFLCNSFISNSTHVRYTRGSQVVNIPGHRHQGQCRRHRNSGIQYLSPVSEHSCTGLGPLIHLQDWYFCSFRYWTDQMPDIPSFKKHFTNVERVTLHTLHISTTGGGKGYTLHVRTDCGG